MINLIAIQSRLNERFCISYLLKPSVFKTLHDEETNNQSTLAKQMDLFNNNVGRESFVGYPPEAAFWSLYSDLAYNLVTSGSLRYISNGQLKPTNQ